MIEQYGTSIICLIPAFACLLYSWANKRDFFQPLIIYIFAQTTTMSFAYLKLMHAMPDLGVITWMAWIGGLIAFLCGTLVFYTIMYREHKPTIEFDAPSTLFDYDWRRHFIFSLILLGLYLAGTAVVISKIGFTILNILDGIRPMEEGKDYGLFASVAFASSPLVVIFFAVASFKAINPHKWIRRISLFLAIFVPLFGAFVYPGRLSLFLSLGSVIVMFNFIKKRIASGIIVLVIMLIFGAFVGVALARGQYGTNTMKGMAAKQVMTLPYKYIANNYWNLDYGMNVSSDRDRHNFTYGLDMFNGPLGMSRFPGSIRQMCGWDDEFNKSVVKVVGLNTVNYIWESYKDFGMAGPVIIPFFISFLMAYIYELMKRKKTPFLWMLYSLSVCFIGLSFFITGYKLAHVWMWVYIMYIATKLCTKRVCIK